MFYVMKKIVSIIVCNILYHVKYENIEQLNQYKRCIICPNHSNIFDPVFIFSKTDDLYIMAKSELFKNKILAKVFKHYHAFPIIREKKDIGGVKYVLALFNKNENIKLLMFPEGGILKQDVRKKKIKNGAVRIAATLNLPIIPVSITENPKLFHKVIVKVKDPIFPNEDVLKNKEKLQEISNQLLNEIYE